MIDYMEKGAGLHRAVTDAGHWLEQRDGVWVSSDDVAVQEIIDSYTLEQAKAEKKHDVSARAREKYDLVTAGISAAEMAGWPILLSEALTYRASGSVGAAIQAEATIRGSGVADLVTKIEGNAAAFQGARAAIAGTDGRKRDEIGALETFEAVAAYNVEGGWPL
ncbi:MAG: hypothetical protein KBG75_10405 [Pseudomonadales bacterium]|nr:hypothetical protein [Pseudomonadales bacterium]